MITNETKERLLMIADRLAVVTLFCGISVLVGFGSNPDLVYALPGYFLITIASAFAIPGAFSAVGRMTIWPVALTTGALTYFVWRACTSPISYFAREDALLIGAGWLVMTTTWGVLARRGWVNSVVWLFAFLGLANGIAAGLQYGGFSDIVELPFMHLADYRERSGGFFGNPNHGAAMGAIGVLAWSCIAFFLRSGIALKLIAVFGAVFCALGMMLAKSRGGVLGLTLALAVLLAFALISYAKQKKKTNWRIGVAVGLGLLVGLLSIGSLGSEILGTRFKKQLVETSKNDVRRYIWKSAFHQFSDAPMLGTGSRTFADFCWRYRVPEMHPSVREAGFVHNEHLQVMAEYGLVGLVLTTGICGLAIGVGGHRICFARRADTEHDGKAHRDSLTGAAFGTSTVIAMAVQGCVEFQMHVPAIFASVSACIGLILVSKNIGESPYRKFGYSIPLLLTGLVLYSGCLLPRYTIGAWNYLKGLEVVRRNGFESLIAVQMFERAVEVDPGLLPAYEKLGKSNFVLAQGPFMADSTSRDQLLRRALGSYISALKIRPNAVPVLIEAGRVSDMLDRTAEAERYFEKAVEWAPLYGSVRNAQGMHFFQRGDWARAREIFEIARKARVAHDQAVTRKMLQTLNALENRES